AVAFGNVDVVSGADYPASGTYTITCDIGLLGLGTVNVSICANIAGANGTTPRAMNSGANTAAYNLYSDSAHSTVWGAFGTTPGIPNPPNPVNLTVSSLLLGGTKSSSPITIYGNLKSSQNTTAIAGGYSASPTATLTYNYSYALLGTPSTPTSCTAGPSGSNASSTFALNVSATVINNCSVTATQVNFGSSVGVLTSAITANGTITATCTNSDSYTIALNKGGASIGDRQMASSGGAAVHYQLYTPTTITSAGGSGCNYGAVWGDTTSGALVSGTGTGAAQNYTVCGRVQAQTTPAPATYQDTILVTVTY
ncbi:MAG: spore coat protein U domain-containing protein, partial [Nevskiales bacterium]